MLALASRGEGGAAPFIAYDVILRARPHDRVFAFGKCAPEESRDARVVPRASRCWRSGLHFTKKLNIYETENHCVVTKLRSDLVYIIFRMC